MAWCLGEEQGQLYLYIWTILKLILPYRWTEEGFPKPRQYSVHTRCHDIEIGSTVTLSLREYLGIFNIKIVINK